MVVMDKSIICNIGTVRYQLDTAIHTNYSVSNEFYYAVKKLPVVYSQADYMKFIEEWGTVSEFSVPKNLSSLLPAHHCRSSTWRQTDRQVSVHI